MKPNHMISQRDLLLFKASPRVKLLKTIKTRLQHAWEYVQVDMLKLRGRNHHVVNPFRPGLQAVEQLLRLPFLSREQIAKYLVILDDGYISQEEHAVLAEPFDPGSLSNENLGEG